MTSSTHFAPQFDAIDVEGAPTRAAVEHAMAMCAVESDEQQPGFYLLSDAAGRFVVERESGIIALRDAGVLEAERDEVQRVRLREISSSGIVYDLDLQLRISGLIPQLVRDSRSEDLSI